MLRCEELDLKLTDKADYKDMEKLVQIVGKFDTGSAVSDDYNLDMKLTSRTMKEVIQQQGLDRVMI
jgi:hypothetical protein